MTEKQYLKKCWKELARLNCNKVMTERIFLQIMQDCKPVTKSEVTIFKQLTRIVEGKEK